jgi:hypothetical protein
MLVLIEPSARNGFLRGLAVSYVSWSIHYEIQHLSPSARLPCMHQGLHTSPEVGQLTSVAKQPNPAAQSNGFENVDWEMQLPSHQNNGVGLKWKGTTNNTGRSPSGNGDRARMSCAPLLQKAQFKTQLKLVGVKPRLSYELRTQTHYVDKAPDPTADTWPIIFITTWLPLSFILNVSEQQLYFNLNHDRRLHHSPIHNLFPQ